MRKSPPSRTAGCETSRISGGSLRRLALLQNRRATRKERDDSISLPGLTHMAPPLVLELFSGTGSIGTAFRDAGWEVFSVDNDPSRETSVCCDVRELDVNTLPRKPDFIWASPVCKHYSVCRRNARTPPDLEGADSLVLAALRIQEHFGCPMLMENPESGLLKTRPFMQNIPRVTVDYCKWWSPGFPHKARKRTAIFLVGADYLPSRPLCRHDCGFCVGRTHEERIGHSSCVVRHVRRLEETYRIPPLLCQEIAQWATEKMRRSEII